MPAELVARLATGDAVQIGEPRAADGDRRVAATIVDALKVRRAPAGLVLLDEDGLERLGVEMTIVCHRRAHILHHLDDAQLAHLVIDNLCGLARTSILSRRAEEQVAPRNAHE